MAYGTELVLRLSREQMLRLAQVSDDSITNYDLWASVPDSVQNQIAQAHRAVLTARFGQAVEVSAGRPLTPWVVNTPAGRREFRRWTIGAYGDETDEARVLGVSLSSRYGPSWLDWRYERGGSGADLVIDSAEFREMVTEARVGLAQAVPDFAGAPLVIVHQFY